MQGGSRKWKSRCVTEIATRKQNMKTVAEKIKERVEEQRELEKQIPLGPAQMMRKRVAKEKLWTRDQRQELAKLAEAFLKERADGQTNQT
jgi:hypothetical protein